VTASRTGVRRPSRVAPVHDGLQADILAAHGLVGVVVRELATPEGRASVVDGHLVVSLRETGRVVRVRLARHSPSGAHRLCGPVQERCAPAPDERWADLALDGLAALVDAELTLRTGHDNPEFVGQVTASRDALRAILAHRPARSWRPVPGRAGAYLDSEQALLAGHPRHPAPKWRCGAAADWYRYAPEGRTAFPLRWLAVPAEHVREQALGPGFDAHARTSALLGPHHDRVQDGYRALPVHPWQFRLVLDDPVTGPVLRTALTAGTVRDLGEVGLAVHGGRGRPPWVRAARRARVAHRRAADFGGWWPLGGARHHRPRGTAQGRAGRRAGPPRRNARRRVPRPRPTASVRTLYQPDVDVFLKTSLNVRITNCLRRNASYELAGAVELTGLLTGPVAGTRTALADLRPAAADPATWAARWWDRYLTLLIPPVLRLWAEHGVVLEPHLQNVLVAVGPDGLPARVVVRDMEGVKLVPGAAALPLSPAVARAVQTTDARGWNRVAYCLFVNNLVEMVGALADLVGSATTRPVEAELWGVAREVVDRTSAALGCPERLRAVLAGRPLPAKANLLVRWERGADREATYVPFPNPLGR
jgi:siderophore synthetase component